MIYQSKNKKYYKILKIKNKTFLYTRLINLQYKIKKQNKTNLKRILKFIKNKKI